MRRNEIIAVILFILATIGTIVGVLGVEKYRLNKFYTVRLIARTPDNGNWYPRTLRLPYGKEAKILIRNIETVTHGFAIPDFNIAVKEIKAGEVKVVKFTPDKKGTFQFMCTVWCSAQHMSMTGEIIVE